MGARDIVDLDDERDRRRAPARTDQERQAYLENLALEVAERQMIEGTVSSQVLTHFLKATTERDKLERAKIEMDIELGNKKLEMMESAKRVEELYEGAIAAMRMYQGQPPLEMPEDDGEGFYED